MGNHCLQYPYEVLVVASTCLPSSSCRYSVFPLLGLVVDLIVVMIVMCISYALSQSCSMSDYRALFSSVSYFSSSTCNAALP